MDGLAGLAAQLRTQAASLDNGEPDWWTAYFDRQRRAAQVAAAERAVSDQAAGDAL